MAKARSSFKTKKGTELPILNLKGKEYLQVMHRLQWFVEEVERYSINSTFLVLEDEKAVCRTNINILTPEGLTVKSASATKSETKKGFADFIEKAESGSIGRALAMLGYGTQFTADELEEGDRLADSPAPVVDKSEPEDTPEKKEPSSKKFKTRSRRNAKAKTTTEDDDI